MLDLRDIRSGSRIKLKDNRSSSEDKCSKVNFSLYSERTRGTANRSSSLNILFGMDTLYAIYTSVVTIACRPGDIAAIEPHFEASNNANRRTKSKRTSTSTNFEPNQIEGVISKVGNSVSATSHCWFSIKHSRYQICK